MKHKYTLDIVIRNIKIHLLTGQGIDFPFNSILKELESIFKDMELIDDGESIVIVDSNREVRFFRRKLKNDVYICNMLFSKILSGKLRGYKRIMDCEDGFISDLTTFYLTYKFPKMVVHDSNFKMFTMSMKDYVSTNDVKYI